MKKILVHLDQIQLENNLKSLQDNVIRYRNYLDACEHITDSREFKTLEQIEEIIKSKSGFSNILLSAGLLDCLDSYKFIESNYSKLNTEILDVDNDGLISTKKEVIEQVKEDCTIYLRSEVISDYEILLKACEQLNKLNNASVSNHLNRTYDGKYSINLMMLHNSDRM